MYIEALRRAHFAAGGTIVDALAKEPVEAINRKATPCDLVASMSVGARDFAP